MLVSCFACFFTLEVTWSSEMSFESQRNIERHTPKNRNLYNHCFQNFKFQVFEIICVKYVYFLCLFYLTFNALYGKLISFIKPVYPYSCLPVFRPLRTFGPINEFTWKLVWITCYWSLPKFVLFYTLALITLIFANIRFGIETSFIIS
jgi:hypothetical protein